MPTVKRSHPRQSANSNTEARRAIGYIRVSATGGRSGPEYHTLEIQRESIERKALALGIELIDIYIEENKSGADPTRPKFREVMERTLAGDADAVIVWKVSRFSRSWSQAAKDTEALMEAGKALIAGDEDFDTSTTGGRMLLRLLFMVAAWEREVLTEQWDEIKERVLARGTHLGRLPFGYLRVRKVPRHDRDASFERALEILRDLGQSHFQPVSGGLVPDPNLVGVVRRTFEYRRVGHSYTDLARLLDEWSPKPAPWAANQVKRLLRNRVYLGEVRYGDPTKGTDLVVQDAHAPIVDRTLFYAVNGEIKTRAYKRGDNEYPLAGLVYCAGCSRKMAGQSPRPGYRVYRCPKNHRGHGRCPDPSTISADHVETLVEAEVAQYANRFDFEVDAVSSDLVQIERRLEALEANMIDMASADARMTYGRDWATIMAKLRDEKNGVERERDNALAVLGSPRTILQYDKSLPSKKRFESLRQVVTAVMIRRRVIGGSVSDRILVVWADIPSPPIDGPVRRFVFPPDGDSVTGHLSLKVSA